MRTTPEPSRTPSIASSRKNLEATASAILRAGGLTSSAPAGTWSSWLCSFHILPKILYLAARESAQSMSRFKLPSDSELLNVNSVFHSCCSSPWSSCGTMPDGNEKKVAVALFTELIVAQSAKKRKLVFSDFDALLCIKAAMKPTCPRTCRRGML